MGGGGGNLWDRKYLDRMYDTFLYLTAAGVGVRDTYERVPEIS